MGVLKDGYDILLGAWRAVRERQWTSIFQALAGQAKVWTVAEWYAPAEAIERFAEHHPFWDAYFDEEHEQIWQQQKELAASDLPEEEQSQLFKELWEKDLENDAAKRAGLLHDLRERLLRGELIARGFREPLSHGAPYLTISLHEWQVLEVKLPDRAEGGGIGYVGLTIGKPGTKQLFRRR